MSLTLYVGNQRYSSWSLRPWICLRQAGLPFETIVLRFDDPKFAAKVPSSAKRVPVLVDGASSVHESLAICEHVAELAPDAQLWPADRALRAQARSFANEMHAGFAALRTECPMDVCRREAPGSWPISDRTRADVARVDAIWQEALARSGGPFLFGRFGVVDAMFAPVVTRFESYGISVSAAARAYMKVVLALPAMEEWYRAGEAERALGWRHYGSPFRSPRDHGDAMGFAVRWAEAWNRRDVEAVLAHFADDVVFTSPKARAITGASTVVGKAALRAYWTEGARRLPPEMRFEVERVEGAFDAHVTVIRYVRRTAGVVERACEVLELDPRTGLVKSGEAYYGA